MAIADIPQGCSIVQQPFSDKCRNREIQRYFRSCRNAPIILITVNISNDWSIADCRESNRIVLNANGSRYRNTWRAYQLFRPNIGIQTATGSTAPVQFISYANPSFNINTIPFIKSLRAKPNRNVYASFTVAGATAAEKRNARKLHSQQVHFVDERGKVIRFACHGMACAPVRVHVRKINKLQN